MGKKQDPTPSANSSTHHTHIPLHVAEASEDWASFQDTNLTIPSEAAAAQMDPVDQHFYVTDLEKCLGEAHC